MFQLTLWSVMPLLAALVCVGAYLRLAAKPRVPGAGAVLAILATVTFWAGCQFVDSLLVGVGLKTLVLKLALVPLALAPVLWLLFAIGYTRRRLSLPPRLRNVLAVIPLISIVLAMTNEWHHLVWRALEPLDADGYAALIPVYGPWFYVHAVYGFGLIVVATTILAYHLSTTTRQVGPVLGVIAAPLVAGASNLFYISPWNPLPWFDFTTLGLAAAALILDNSVLRHGVLDDIPVLRDRVLEQLGDPVIVIDAANRIIDLNGAAGTLLGIAPGTASGRLIGELLPTLSLARLISGGTDEVHAHERWFDVTASRLDPTSSRSDLVLAFRDVTVRRRTEQELRKAQAELQRLAHTDPLTGLNNRRLFMERLDEEVRRIERHAGALSVVILDLDHFKTINDSHGHDAGDRVLAAVAEQVRVVKRGTDVAARIGGEEFALLLPATDTTGAAQLADRLCGAIRRLDTTPLLGNGAATTLAVTASLGFATMRHGDPALQSLLKRADEALYRAKHGGRDRVSR